MEYTQKAQEFFAADRFATEAAGIEILEARPGFAYCKMEIRPIHRNAVGAVMGGALFTLADFAFAIASNLGGIPTVSLNSTIQYLSGTKGAQLFAHTMCVKDGKTVCVYRIVIEDDCGVQVATVETTGFKRKP